MVLNAYVYNNNLLLVCIVCIIPYIMKSSELIKQITALGWVFNRSNGSHHIFTHPKMGGHLCIPHPRKDLGVGLVEKILKQARGKQ